MDHYQDPDNHVELVQQEGPPAGVLLGAGALPAVTDMAEAMQLAAMERYGEIFAQVTLAKQSPRDEAIQKGFMLRECESFEFADNAWYRYPTGKKKVVVKGKTEWVTNWIEGHNIRSAEMMAKHWQNMKNGIIELGRDNETGMSTIQAFSWDIQNNVTIQRTLMLPHRRDVGGSWKRLKTEREVRNMVFNIGQRTLRSCILVQIPPRVKNEVRAKCLETKEKGPEGVSEQKQRESMVAGFDALGVPSEALIAFLGHPVDSTSGAEISDMRAVYRAIESGEVAKHEVFDLTGIAGSGSSSILEYLDTVKGKGADDA